MRTWIIASREHRTASDGPLKKELGSMKKRVDRQVGDALRRIRLQRAECTSHSALPSGTTRTDLRADFSHTRGHDDLRVEIASPVGPVVALDAARVEHVIDVPTAP